MYRAVEYCVADNCRCDDRNGVIRGEISDSVTDAHRRLTRGDDYAHTIERDDGEGFHEIWRRP